MLNEDYKEMLQSLLDQGVSFLVVGAYAMGAHGYPRATGDIDLWVEPSANNAARVHRALAAFGAPLQGIDDTTFAEREIVFQIGVAPRRIDIITHIDGVRFEEAYRNREVIDIESMPVPFLSRRDLIKNKRATGREKDRLDADALDRDPA
jgi:hypothetical protein